MGYFKESKMTSKKIFPASKNKDPQPGLSLQKSHNASISQRGIFVVNPEKSWVIFIAVFFCVFTAFAAPAEEKKTKVNFKPTGVVDGTMGKTYDQETLDEESIRKCFEKEKALEKSEENLNGAESVLNGKLAEITSFAAGMDTMSKALAEMKEKGFNVQTDVDKYNKEIDTYNVKIVSYDILIEEKNELESEFNELVDVHNKMNEDFTLNCTNKKYYTDDYKKVEAEFK